METDWITLKFTLVELDVAGLDIQDKVPGFLFVVLLMPEVTTLKWLLNHTNIFISAVSEFGPDVDAEPVDTEDTQEEKLDSNMPDKVVLMGPTVHKNQSKTIIGILTSPKVQVACTPKMMPEAHGGSVTWELTIKSD